MNDELMELIEELRDSAYRNGFIDGASHKCFHCDHTGNTSTETEEAESALIKYLEGKS